jgi:DNA-directed RNA polymerase specialized sigma24 family protein
LSLDRLFEALPDAQQRAIELVRIEGLSISEASTSTGQSESLIKVNIQTGLKRLAALIERSQPYGPTA